MVNVAALRRLLGVPETLDLMPAIRAMNAMMGICGEGALPVQLQVAKLIAETGMVVAPATAPADEAAHAAAAPTTAPEPDAAPAAAGKRKAEPPAAALVSAKKQKQHSLFSVMPDAPKTIIPAAELRKQRLLAAHRPRTTRPIFTTYGCSSRSAPRCRRFMFQRFQHETVSRRA